jgi:sec-independent protein translocase protein TatB
MIGWSELLVIGLVALLVVGPEELPKVLRGVYSAVRKVKSLAREVQDELAELARDPELDMVRRQVETSLSEMDIRHDLVTGIEPEKPAPPAASPPPPEDKT